MLVKVVGKNKIFDFVDFYFSKYQMYKNKQKFFYYLSKRLRKFFGLDTPPYDTYVIFDYLKNDLISLPLNHDIHMIAQKYHINLDDIDGLSFTRKNKTVYIDKGLKNNFTKAHEIFEILLHPYGIFTESDCNQGAAEFLMPKNEFLGEANATLINIFYLSEIFNCSLLSISIRALDLEMVEKVTADFNGKTRQYGKLNQTVDLMTYEIAMNYYIKFGFTPGPVVPRFTGSISKIGDYYSKDLKKI